MMGKKEGKGIRRRRGGCSVLEKEEEKEREARR
jgi:hypothetical protein